jgi:adenosine deaminase
MDSFVKGLPKAELHVHIEGTLEPEMVFDQSVRNTVELPYGDVESLRGAYKFTDLQSFLDIYYQTAAVLQTERDFYELMTAYLERAAADGVRRAEIFFDPQTHTERGIGYDVFMPGFQQAIADAESRLPLSADLILCFLRHLGGAAAIETLRDSVPFLDRVIAVGLDSTEIGFPPHLFSEAYDMARQLGLRAVAHGGEEGPPSFVTGALDDLGVERIDHGIRSLEDPDLVARLVAEQIPLTVCPFSNVALGVVERLADHPLPKMVESGLMVTVNSDDPAYFGGYVADNYLGLTGHLGFDRQTLTDLARNSIRASFSSPAEISRLLEEIDSVSSQVN